jgi:anti-sigma-K factor RskA
MRSHETFDELAAVYTVGALDGDDLVRFEAHLAEGCERCAQTLRESEEALARIALASAPAVPPPAVKASLQQRVAADGRGRPASRASWVPWTAATAAAAAVAAMVTSGVVASRYEAQLGHMARETAAVRQRLQTNERLLREEMAVYQRAVELLRDPATRVVELRGAGPSPAASARMIWHDKAGGQLFVANLPAAPPGKTYELWALDGPGPKAAGTFQVDASGRATHRVEPGGPASAKFAVTLEPEPGVTAPTGPLVLAGR